MERNQSGHVDTNATSTPLPFDPTDPATYTRENLTALSLTDLLNALNDVPRRNTLAPEEALQVKTLVLHALFFGLQAQRRRHDARTLRRTPMFATRDGASMFRPPIGLKRTFYPKT
nr:small capsid protein UL35 [Psittacid alphaherpesvirus 6]